MLEATAVLIGFAAMVLLAWDANSGFQLRWGRIAIIAAVALAAAFFAFPARSQHVHPDETISDPRVAKFYEEWKRPPARVISCCNSTDCYSAPIRPGLKGGIEYFHKWSRTWASIPASVLEHNQPDALDSPNHAAHVCASPYAPDLVYCAVLGSGT